MAKEQSFQQMVLNKWISIPVQKNDNSRPYLTPNTKIHSKLIEKLNANSKAITTLEENTEQNL